MRQLTVRMDEELEREIQKVADEYDTSLNKAVLRLLRRGAGLDEDGSTRGGIGNALDRHFGNWTDEEADEFDATMADFERIDEEMWE